MQPSSPRSSPRAIFELLGETESGSAGEQPDKGSSSQGRVKDARLPRLPSRGSLFVSHPLERPCRASKNAFRSGGTQPQPGSFPSPVFAA